MVGEHSKSPAARWVRTLRPATACSLGNANARTRGTCVPLGVRLRVRADTQSDSDVSGGHTACRRGGIVWLRLLGSVGSCCVRCVQRTSNALS